MWPHLGLQADGKGSERLRNTMLGHMSLSSMQTSGNSKSSTAAMTQEGAQGQEFSTLIHNQVLTKSFTHAFIWKMSREQVESH